MGEGGGSRAVGGVGGHDLSGVDGLVVGGRGTSHEGGGSGSSGELHCD